MKDININTFNPLVEKWNAIIAQNCNAIVFFQKKSC